MLNSFASLLLGSQWPAHFQLEMGLGFSRPVYSLHLFTIGAHAGCVLDCLAEISSNVP